MPPARYTHETSGLGPSGPGTRTQTTTITLPMSSPATRSNITSMSSSLHSHRQVPPGGTSSKKTDPRAHGNNPARSRSPRRTLLRAQRHQSLATSPGDHPILTTSTGPRAPASGHTYSSGICRQPWLSRRPWRAGPRAREVQRWPACSPMRSAVLADSQRLVCAASYPPDARCSSPQRSGILPPRSDGRQP